MSSLEIEEKKHFKETDIVDQSQGPETDIMGETYYILRSFSYLLFLIDIKSKEEEKCSITISNLKINYPNSDSIRVDHYYRPALSQ